MNEKNVNSSGELRNELIKGKDSSEEKRFAILETKIGLSHEKTEIHKTNAEIACTELEKQINSYRDGIDDELSHNHEADA